MSSEEKSSLLVSQLVHAAASILHIRARELACCSVYVIAAWPLMWRGQFPLHFYHICHSNNQYPATLEFRMIACPYIETLVRLKAIRFVWFKVCNARVMGDIRLPFLFQGHILVVHAQGLLCCLS